MTQHVICPPPKTISGLGIAVVVVIHSDGLGALTTRLDCSGLMLDAMQVAAVNTWPSGWHSHSTRTRLWALCCAIGFTGLVLMPFLPDRRHGPYDGLPPPVVLSVRLLPDWSVQTSSNATPSQQASRPPKTSFHSLQASEIANEDRRPKTPKAPKALSAAPQIAPVTQTQPLSVDTDAPSALTTTPSAGAPLDLSSQTTGRALQAVPPRRSLSEAARQQHGLAGPHERERWSDAVSRSAKPDCLAGHPQGSLLDLPVRLLQALRAQCK